MERTPSPVAIRRRRLGLSQFRLAVKADLSPSTVSLAERTGYLTRATAARLARALDCQPKDLLPQPTAEERCP